jgi:hypothetical protein
MHKYEIIIYWINEDGVFVAEAPELAGWRMVTPRDQPSKMSKTPFSYGLKRLGNLVVPCPSLKAGVSCMHRREEPRWSSPPQAENATEFTFPWQAR